MALTKVKGSVWDGEDNGQALSVKDYGAVGDGSDEVAKFQAAIDATTDGTIAVINVPSGSYTGDMTTLNYGTRTVVFAEQGDVTYPTAAPTANRTNAKFSTGDITRPWFYGENGFIDDTTDGTSADRPVVRIQRNASHTGGTTGGSVVSAALSVLTNCGANVQNYENAITAVLENEGGIAGQNYVGTHVECRKNANGAGKTFGANIVVQDLTGNASATSLGALIGHELTMNASGADDANTRIAQDTVLKKPTGAAATSYYVGIRVRPSDATNRETTIKNGIILQDGTNGAMTTGLFINAAHTAGEAIKVTSKAVSGKIRLGTDASSGTVSELLGIGDNSAAAETDYTKIRSVIVTNTAGSEDARIDFRTLVAGTETTMFQATGSATNGLNILVGGTVKTVSQGAADSESAGFRSLRVPN